MDNSTDIGAWNQLTSDLAHSPLAQQGPFGEAARRLSSYWEQQSNGNQATIPRSLLLPLGAALRTVIETGSIERAFLQLLPDVLKVSQSDFGFLAEVEYGTSGAPYFLSHAVVDVYKPNYGPHDIVSNLQFHNLNTLNGAVMTSRRPVLTNDPGRDPRSGGLPHGHARLKAYLGLPFLVDDELVGGAALGNKAGGYSDADISFLEPLCEIGGLMIAGYRETR